MTTRKNRGVRGYRQVPPSRQAVLVDTQIARYLALRAKDVSHWPQSDRADLQAFLTHVEPLLGVETLQIQPEVVAELPDWLRAAFPQLTSTASDASYLASFVSSYESALLPTNTSLADVAIAAEAWRTGKYVLALDAWVLGKAQAMGLAHPRFAGVYFTGGAENVRQLAFENWNQLVGPR